MSRHTYITLTLKEIKEKAHLGGDELKQFLAWHSDAGPASIVRINTRTGELKMDKEVVEVEGDAIKA